ncbi:hypothetical protein N431DRAFT_383408 [Stipitochalara longipes BDJ]|nr:hypothetical protein N431DRAFT_383408 [Stipitochalara longipes BDJ]
MDDRLDPGSAMEDPPPDLMNDPQYATNTANGEDGIGDADTCRICRGEGSDTEPLFHPCKCSGSIKYVHQDCLMEWLSHSQKKHCELCKTAFRFTKLYSPNMPQTLPIHVLFRHVIIHTVKNITTWLRFCLVVTVWLGFLPYIIRQVWRLLFWFSDGGWPPQYLSTDSTRNSTAMKALEMARELQLATLTGNGTSPITPFLASQTTSASVGGVMNKLVQFLKPVSQTLNISSADPLAAGLFKSLYYGFGTSNVVIPEGTDTNISVSQLVTGHSSASRNPSLLSEIPFLRDLTRNPYINQLIITVAEGYIITILVVVCFILVFLIREWVVQQQPGINMGAGFNAEFAVPERPREQQAVPEPRVLPNGGDVQEPREIGQRPMARPRRRNPHFGDGDDMRPAGQNLEQGNAPDSRVETGTLANRPTAVRDALSPAAEIQRVLTEEPRMTEEFLAIWRRADSDPKEVLRIIETENKGDQLRYWVNAMKLLQTPPLGSQALPVSSSASSSALIAGTSTGPSDMSAIKFTSSENSSTDDLGKQTASDGSSASSESWIEIPKPLVPGHHNNASVESNPNINRTPEYRPLDKGKRPAIEKPTEPSLPQNERYVDENTRPVQNPFTSGSSSTLWTSSGPVSFSSNDPRPRAVSDGTRTKDTMLVNNWSFSNLPEVDNDHNILWDKGNDTTAESSKTVHTPTSLTQPIVLENHIHDSNAWKAAQDLRVQQAFARGIEVHQSLLTDNELTPQFLKSKNDTENTSKEKEDSTETHDQEVWRPTVYEPVELSDSDNEPVVLDEMAVPNVLPAEVQLPETREIVVVHPPEPQGLLANIADFLWGGVGDDRPQEEQGANDEHIVQDLAAEAPFVPVAHQDPFDQGGEFAEQDREVVEAAIAAGIDPNDQDAIDDAEDFEGIMELVGMRGPIFSLVQNALFSAFLLALTVAFGIWIPYNIGRVSLLLLANPGPAFKLPLRLIFGLAALMQDLALSLMGIVSWCLIRICSVPLSIWYSASDRSPGQAIRSAALNVSQSALERVMDGTVNSLVHIGDSEIFAFSAASHESLIYLKNLLIDTLIAIGASVSYIFIGDYNVTRTSIWAVFVRAVTHGWHFISVVPGFLARSDSWVISLELGKRSSPLNLELSVWSGMDRFCAIVAGYTALSLLGAMYVKKGSPFSSGPVGREWEATIIDLLNQAGGVMKVILIISIEMLVFPLYCGLLLDAALLPLFDKTTIVSRILFTFKSPLTSIFVHWFVGTCYMFHFALFVSMCRKIMRKGVLYFIRDPDDPTFHPVRDVLERNVATQLRKILFSALVYGGLVVICLGGVVWGLSFAFKGVLPIHWSSNEPVLEFPIDLLFYNFLMPLAVKFFKPSDGLYTMYSWWFRQCARMLRLTWFMFDERKEDEEGYIVRRSWIDIFRGVKGEKILRTEDLTQPFVEDPELNAYFRLDGKYVRAPASDQVRIPKGTSIFLEVDALNNRVDGKWDRPDGVHGKDSELYKQVYIPPWFRLRICLFIVFIWLFAALTGVSITIVPLVFGRQVFAKLIPAHVRKNDVYAFSIGIYILGSGLYAIVHIGKFISYLRSALAINAETPKNVMRQVAAITTLAARIAWTYTAFLVILPTLFAFLIEFYFIVPLHTYFAFEERHVIHFVQSWTLGLLYVKLTTRIVLWHEESRPAQSLRAITRDGYLNPDARLATRSFILPVGLLLCSALAYPWCLARVVTLTVLRDKPEKHLLTYRYAYPMCLALGCIGFALYILLGWVKDWRMKIRDEVYLIGERLHNFGDRKTGSNGVAVPNMRRIET